MSPPFHSPYSESSAHLVLHLRNSGRVITKDTSYIYIQGREAPTVVLTDACPAIYPYEGGGEVEKKGQAMPRGQAGQLEGGVVRGGVITNEWAYYLERRHSI